MCFSTLPFPEKQDDFFSLLCKPETSLETVEADFLVHCFDMVSDSPIIRNAKSTRTTVFQIRPHFVRKWNPWKR